MNVSQEVQAFSIPSDISASCLNSAVTATGIVANFSGSNTYKWAVNLRPAPTDN